MDWRNPYVCMDYRPQAPCLILVGGVLTIIPKYNSDNLQFPIMPFQHWEHGLRKYGVFFTGP